jgi:hypothetical protein
VEVSTNVVPVEVAAAQEMEKAQLEIPMPPPPPPESSLPPSPIELAPQQRSPPKALSLLRKSPQSFPPLGAITYEHEEAPIRPAKSAMSVSFGAADGNGKKEDEGKRQQQPEGKRRVCLLGYYEVFSYVKSFPFSGIHNKKFTNCGNPGL